MNTTSLFLRVCLICLQIYHADLLVDDPYFYLYFSDQPRSPSYFKLDGQGSYPRGRVLRFDSLSKVLSAGLRFGFATGPARLIERINVHVGHHLIAKLEVVITLRKDGRCQSARILDCPSYCPSIAYRLGLRHLHGTYASSRQPIQGKAGCF